MRLPSLLAIAACLLAAGCRSTAPLAAPDPAREDADLVAPARGHIVVCGRKVPVDAPVVLWTDFPAYDAYRTTPRFGQEDEKSPKGLRYQPGRRTTLRPAAEGRAALHQVLVEPGESDPLALARVVDQFVLHYDVCGLARTCFKVLQDQRGLSVHFLLDIDGTIYQTMDLREQAFHATKSNARSIGVEIAHIGAYKPFERSPLDEWYARDGGGPYISIPERFGDGGVRTPGFVGRPAREALVRGEIQGQLLEQYDFTPEQYASLTSLAAALCKEFPRLAPDAPRDAEGRVLDRAMSDEAWRDFGGILGHYHIQTNKTDPGPGFDWEPFLAEVRRKLALRR